MLVKAVCLIFHLSIDLDANSLQGAGMYMRMKAHMRDHVDQIKNTMFKESCDEVKTRLNKMCRQVEESMNNKTDEVFLLMRRDYLQVLNGAQVSGEVMPKWERNMRSQIARALETHEKDEAEKVATGVKDEEAEDVTMKDFETAEVDGDNKDESAEGSVVHDDEVNAEDKAEDVTEKAKAATVKSEQLPDDGGIDSNKGSESPGATTEVELSEMDVDSPSTGAAAAEAALIDDVLTESALADADLTGDPAYSSPN